MKEKLFSIIIPIFNREFCVHRAIDSVCRQDYSKWELILVDDGSTDRTGDICTEYAKQDARIFYRYKNNGGVSSARNLGIQKAGGEYILFLDSDDSLAANCLSSLNSWITKISNEPDILCFGAGLSSKQWYPTDNKSGEYITQEKIRESYLPTHINIYSQEQYFLLNYVWNKCYRTEFIRRNGLSFDEKRRTWEDGLFVVNCLDSASEIILAPEVLYHGFADPSVDHLSGAFFESQIEIYIQDEINFKTRFEDEYDFSSAHYCHANLRTINILFSRAYNVYGKMSKPLMESAAKSPMIMHWIVNINPQNSFERYFRSCILHEKYHWIFYYFYIRNVIKRVRG